MDMLSTRDIILTSAIQRFNVSLMRMYWDKLTRKEKKNAYYATVAAASGNLESLIWLHRYGCGWNEETCEWAARMGRLDILEYLRLHGCPWNNWTITFAAENGHLDIVIWALKNECPYDHWVVVCPAYYGHLKILKYLLENGVPYHPLVMTGAIKSNKTEIIDWLNKWLNK